MFNLLSYEQTIKCKGKGKVKVHLMTDYEGPDGSRGIALLFL